MFYLKCVYVNGCYQPREYHGSMRIPIFDRNHTLKPSLRRSGAEKWFCHAISPLSPCTAALLHSIIKNRSIISLVLQPKYFPNQAGILQNNMVQVGNDVNNTVYKKNTFSFVDLLFFRDKKKLLVPGVSLGVVVCGCLLCWFNHPTYIMVHQAYLRGVHRQPKGEDILLCVGYHGLPHGYPPYSLRTHIFF